MSMKIEKTFKGARKTEVGRTKTGRHCVVVYGSDIKSVIKGSSAVPRQFRGCHGSEAAATAIAKKFSEIPIGRLPKGKK